MKDCYHYRTDETLITCEYPMQSCRWKERIVITIELMKDCYHYRTYENVNKLWMSNAVIRGKIKMIRETISQQTNMSAHFKIHVNITLQSTPSISQCAPANTYRSCVSLWVSPFHKFISKCHPTIIKCKLPATSMTPPHPPKKPGALLRQDYV